MTNIVIYSIQFPPVVLYAMEEDGCTIVKEILDLLNHFLGVVSTWLGVLGLPHFFSSRVFG